MFYFHGFKDNSIVFINKGKNQSQCNIISMKYSAIQLIEDDFKRGSLSWKETLFLEKKSPEGECHYPIYK